MSWHETWLMETCLYVLPYNANMNVINTLIAPLIDSDIERDDLSRS